MQPAITSPSGGSGNTQQAAGRSSSYGARVAARIKRNITYPVEVASIIGNPGAKVLVRVDADGTIVSFKLLESSAIKTWDEAVIRAIEKTETLPRDIDGRVPPEGFEFTFRPKD